VVAEGNIEDTAESGENNRSSSESMEIGLTSPTVKDDSYDSEGLIENSGTSPAVNIAVEVGEPGISQAEALESNGSSTLNVVPENAMPETTTSPKIPISSIKRANNKSKIPRGTVSFYKD